MSKDFKFSIPIISSEELKIIDNKFNDIIDKVINESLFLRETLIEARLLKNLRNENKHLKKQNKFLMKQDNILQTLMQWLYSQYNESLSKFEMIRRVNTDYKIYEKVIDKIKELKEELK